jgi:DNA-binding MarR family transcriptional regulator
MSKFGKAVSRSGKDPCAHGDPQENLGYAVKQLHHLMRAAIEHRMRAHGLGLTLPHAAALFLLSESPGLSGAQLARWTMVTPQTMNQILTRLETDGLIVREPDPEHGRILRARITRKGEREFERGGAVAEGLIAEAQGGLSARERAELMRLLNRCQDNLRRIAKAEKTPLEDIDPVPAGKPRTVRMRRATSP